MELPDAELAQVRQRLTGELGWDELLRLASWHQVAGFLHVALRRPELADLVPAPALELLKATHFQQRMKNLLLTRELRRALEVLARDEVPVVVLKGAALLRTVYEDPGLRPMSDIDVLVHGTDMDRTAALLGEIGYRPDEHDPQFHSRTLVSPERACSFDVHLSLKFPYDEPALWARARPLTLHEAPLLVPGPEDLVAHLAAHFFGDRRYRSDGALRQLCDIAETVRAAGADFDWDLLVGEAERSDIQGRVFVPLLAAAELLEAPFPPSARRRLRPVDFTDALGRRFVERRVLRARPWFSVELLERRHQPLQTLFPSRSRLEARHGRLGRLDRARLYGRRALNAARLAGSSVLRVREVAQDARLNRKLTSL